MVMIGVADEHLLVADEEGRLAVAGPLGGLGQREADRAQPEAETRSATM